MSRSPIPEPVKLLGWTSFFTDVASEMIYPLLPVYLSKVLGANAVSLGAIEGFAEGVNSLLKVGSGHLSDRTRRRRPIVIAGYSLSSLARPLIAVTTSWVHVLAIRAIDRTGKGIRGAPRDALLAAYATQTSRGRVFGFQRAMDHAGAIVGPLVATAVLWLAPENYRLLFMLTAVPGAIAVALLFLVREPSDNGAGNASSRLGGTAVLPTLATPPPKLPGRLWSFYAALMIFSLGNSTDAFLLLRLSDVLGSSAFIPLLWSGLHVVKASLSTWGGSLSDVVGRKRIIILGWLIYALVYLAFAMVTQVVAMIAWFLAYGVYFALTEGVEKALVADLTPAERRGASLGIYNAVLGVGALAASLLFGVLYTRFGPAVAFGTGAALAGVAAIALAFVPVTLTAVRS